MVPGHPRPRRIRCSTQRTSANIWKAFTIYLMPASCPKLFHDAQPKKEWRQHHGHAKRLIDSGSIRIRRHSADFPGAVDDRSRTDRNPRRVRSFYRCLRSIAEEAANHPDVVKTASSFHSSPPADEVGAARKRFCAGIPRVRSQAGPWPNQKRKHR